jgi:hypothetical protein
MQFLRAGMNNYSHNQEQQLPTMLSRRRVMQIPKQSVSVVNNVVSQEPPKPTMIWGPAIWFLFHTLAEKVKPEAFPIIRQELLNNIYAIASHLPCPVCSEHAKEYLGKINFNSIQTKDDLKMLLFQFHNSVNQRKGYQLFTGEELNSKYSQANTVKIIQNFMIHFKDKHRSPKLIADDLQRSRIAVFLQQWFQQNIGYFDL